MLEIQHLTKQFGGFTAVDDLSFSVTSGEVLGFLGPNGAGKSTTMKMITGFLTPTSGAVLIDNIDVQKQTLAIKQKIGYLPEGAPAYGEMTVIEFLRFIARIRSLGAASQARVDYVIEQTQLQPVLYKSIDTLSKGFKRRVGLAQAIIHDPEILILDEPTDGLDPNQKQEVRRLISEMAASKTIIVSTHILEEVDAVCSRAMVIANGQLLIDATPTEIKQQANATNLDEAFRTLTATRDVQQAA